MLDICTPSLLLAQIVGRVGDFFNRASFGEYTTWVTRMRLPLEAVSAGNVTSLMRENLQVAGEKSYILVHPAFLYECLWCLLLLVTLVARKHKKLFDGEIFLKYLVGYGLGRAVIEYLRTDQMPVPFLSFFLPLNLCVSLVLAVFSFLILLVRRSMAKKRRAYRRARREAAYEKRRQWEKEEEEEDEEDVFALLEDLEEERRRELGGAYGEEAPVKSVMDEVTEAASFISPRGKEPAIPRDLSSFDMEEVDREVEEVYRQREEPSYASSSDAQEASSYESSDGMKEASSYDSLDGAQEEPSYDSSMDAEEETQGEESAKEALELLAEMEAEEAGEKEEGGLAEVEDLELLKPAGEAEEEEEKGEDFMDSSEESEPSASSEPIKPSEAAAWEPLDDEDGFLSE